MNEEYITALAAEMGGEEEPQFPAGHHGLKLDMAWRPKLNPTQQKVYDSTSDYVLAYGERGTGKSIVGIDKLVNHCVRNKNALALVVVKESGIAQQGGCWDKLVNEVLPQWKHGNFDRKTGKRLDKGCGIEYTAPKLGALDKKMYVWITNRHGSWSMVVLITLFVGDHVEDKTKGKEPSFVLLDEAQVTDTADYLSKLGQQLGRRQDVDDNQQLVFAANPKGPSHWLYKAAFLHGQDEEGNPIECPIDPETGHPMLGDTPVKTWSVFHVPISENLHNLPPGYWPRVLEATKNDPIERQRMVEGIWIDKPEGDALFREAWKDETHLRGDLRKAQGLMPLPGHLFVIGWDPGAAHTAIAMLQFVPTPQKVIWMQFDEMNFVGKYMPYRRLVPKLIDRLVYWEYAVSEMTEKKVEFAFRHISDNSAFNQFRAKEGSFDAQDIEDISRAYVKEKELPERFIIRMRECPKGPHSVEARVRLTTDLLLEESLLVSATCSGTRNMMLGLEEDKNDRMKPKRSKHLHPFDALSYPFLYFSSGIGRSATKVPQVQVQEFYPIGRG